MPLPLMVRVTTDVDAVEPGPIRKDRASSADHAKRLAGAFADLCVEEFHGEFDIAVLREVHIGRDPVAPQRLPPDLGAGHGAR